MTRSSYRMTVTVTAFAALALILASCNLPAGDAPALTQAAVNTSAALTLAAMTTQTPTPTPTSTGTATPTSTPPVNPPSPTNTTAPLACNRAQFVSDVTVPDGTTFTPGSSFRKTWRLRNAGSCTWTSGYVLIFDNGERMNAPASVQLTSGSIAPDQTVDVSVDLVAPAGAGSYRADFRLRSADNQPFGVGANGQGTFWVKIGVSTGTVDAATLFRNAQYRLNASSPQVVQLVNGAFQQGVPGDANYISVTTTDFIVAGDLNGDGVREVIGPVVENYGGTGKFVYLTVYEQVGQGLVFKSSFLVDDRPVLNALSIDGDRVVLDAVIHAPEDPLCCPTLNKVFRLRYVNGGLVE